MRTFVEGLSWKAFLGPSNQRGFLRRSRFLGEYGEVAIRRKGLPVHPAIQVKRAVWLKSHQIVRILREYSGRPRTLWDFGLGLNTLLGSGNILDYLSQKMFLCPMWADGNGR